MSWLDYPTLLVPIGFQTGHPDRRVLVETHCLHLLSMLGDEFFLSGTSTPAWLVASRPGRFIAPRQPEPPIVQLLSENGVDRLKVLRQGPLRPAAVPAFGALSCAGAFAPSEPSQRHRAR